MDLERVLQELTINEISVYEDTRVKIQFGSMAIVTGRQSLNVERATESLFRGQPQRIMATGNISHQKGHKLDVGFVITGHDTRSFLRQNGIEVVTQDSNRSVMRRMIRGFTRKMKHGENIHNFITQKLYKYFDSILKTDRSYITVVETLD